MTSPQVGFAFLDQIERALVLALAMSRQKQEWPEDWPGSPATELPGLLHKLAVFGGPLSLVRTRPGEFGRFHDGILLAVEGWAGTSEHFTRRHELIALLIEVRGAVLENMRALPESAEVFPKDAGPRDSHWQRTSEQAVEVRFRGVVRTITGDRNAWIFSEVAKARGIEVSWSDLIKRRMKHTGKAKVLSVETMERYGREIRDQLAPFGDLWKQGAKGASWEGGDELQT